MEKFEPFGPQSIPRDQFLSLLQVSSELLWVRDMREGTSSWLSSPENIEKYNLPPQGDISIEGWTYLIHEEDRAKALTLFRQALKDKSITTFEHEYRVKGKDRLYFIRDKVRIQRNAEGVALQCMGAWNDFTVAHERTAHLQESLAVLQQLNQELMQYQQKLKTNEIKLAELNAKLSKSIDLLSENEAMLKTSQQIAKTGSWKYNLKTGKCSCSEEFFVIYGLDPDFNLTDPEFFLKVLYGTQKGSEILESVDKLKGSGVPFDIVSSVITPLGIQKFIRLVAYPLYTGDTVTEIQGVVHDITAFKEAEERLRASEEKFFTIFKFTPDFMSLARESDGVIVEVNNKAYAMSGYSENEMVGKTARELNLWINPEELDKFFLDYSNHHKATCETVWRKKDGKSISIMLSSQRVQVGEEYFRLSLVKDITARKETEERLQLSEEKFSKLFRFNPDLMCLARESDYVIVEVNDKVKAVTGYTQEETIGKTAKELNLWVNPDDLDELFSEYNSQLGQVTQETKWQKKNGQKIDVMVSTVRIEIGGENYGLTIVKDITARKEAEEKFSKAFNLSPDLMSIIRERDQVIVEVNENGKNMLGYSREETLGKTTVELNLWVEPEERDKYYQIYRRKPTISYEARWRKKNGEEIYVVINATRVELYDEPHILSSVRDVTAQKAVENLLRQSEANLNATVNNTRLMIWSIDVNYILLTCNEATRQYARNYYNVNLEVGDSLKTKILDKVLDPETETFWKDMYSRALRGEVVIQNYSAFDRHSEVSLNPIRANGTVTGVTVFTTDTTERVAHHREVVKNLEQLADVAKKLGEAKIMALRSAMNPHFIFNALNSIQFYISKNERQQAIQYLSTFSKLIRGTLNSSGQNTIKLKDELELLKHYIELELIRFEKKFNVTFTIDPKLNSGNTEIPSLVVQPFVENAILHGLYDKRSEGNLKISISLQKKEFILFEVEDDGIGRQAAQQIQAKKNLEGHKSMGISLAEERLKIINSDPDFRVETIDLFDGEKPCGTRVKIWLRIP